MPKDSQKWLNVGFNMSGDHLKILYQGFDVEKLPLKVITETSSSSHGQILSGAIRLNNVEVHSGIALYTSSTFDNWCAKYNLGSITAVEITSDRDD